MKLALESTTDLLSKVQGFGDFDWISFSRASKDKEYLDFYQQSTQPRVLNLGDGSFAPDIGQVKEAYESLGSPVIISPDFAGEQARTISAYDMYCQEYGVENVIGVLQGASYKEVLGCLTFYKGQVAVPFNIGSADETTNSLMALRRALIVSNIPADRFVHLLGFTTLDELEWYETKPNVLSINTGYPVMLGMRSEDILDIGKECDKAESTLSKMEQIEAANKELSQTQWTGIIRNVALLRRYIS